MKLGEHLLCFSSKLQKSVALSSGEAELSAQVGGLTDVLGIEHLFREFGMNLSVRSCCDSSAAQLSARRLVARVGDDKILLGARVALNNGVLLTGPDGGQTHSLDLTSLPHSGARTPSTEMGTPLHRRSRRTC